MSQVRSIIRSLIRCCPCTPPASKISDPVQKVDVISKESSNFPHAEISWSAINVGSSGQTQCRLNPGQEPISAVGCHKEHPSRVTWLKLSLLSVVPDVTVWLIRIQDVNISIVIVANSHSAGIVFLHALDMTIKLKVNSYAHLDGLYSLPSSSLWSWSSTSKYAIHGLYLLELNNSYYTGPI